MDDAAKKAREEYLKKYLSKDDKQSAKKHKKKKKTGIGFVVTFFQIGTMQILGLNYFANFWESRIFFFGSVYDGCCFSAFFTVLISDNG